MSYPFECVIMTHESAGTPHLAALAAANPGLVIHVHTAADPADEAAGLIDWRNNDRNIRTWWLANREVVTADQMLVLEWDVFCNVDLRTTLPARPAEIALLAPRLARPIRDRKWPVFAETARLPRELRGYAVGAVPFAALLVSREALNAVCAEEWDGLFAADVFCELRFPTVLRSAGFWVADNPGWAGVGLVRRQPDAGFRGMMHPVKEEVVS